jgi:cytochrome c
MVSLRSAVSAPNPYPPTDGTSLDRISARKLLAPIVSRNYVPWLDDRSGGGGFMRHRALGLLAVVLALVIPCTLLAQSNAARGTPAEAKALMQKAVAHYLKVGRKQALEDFNTNRKEWVDRDLYVFCSDKRHVIVANAGFLTLVGQSADSVLDVNGKPRGQAAWDATAATGEGSVEYRWLNPVTGKTEPKKTFERRVGEDLCGVGVYNPNGFKR